MNQWLQWAKEKTRETMYAISGRSDTEKLVLEATNDDKWGPTNSQMEEISRLTFNYSDCESIKKVIWERLEQTDEIRYIQKTLILLEYLLRNGHESFRSEVHSMLRLLQSLSSMHRYQVGENAALEAVVRKKAADIIELASDNDVYRAEREKASNIKKKVSSYSNSGGGYYNDFGGYGSNRYGSMSSNYQSYELPSKRRNDFDSFDTNNNSYGQNQRSQQPKPQNDDEYEYEYEDDGPPMRNQQQQNSQGFNPYPNNNNQQNQGFNPYPNNNNQQNQGFNPYPNNNNQQNQGFNPYPNNNNQQNQGFNPNQQNTQGSQRPQRSMGSGGGLLPPPPGMNMSRIQNQRMNQQSQQNMTDDLLGFGSSKPQQTSAADDLLGFGSSTSSQQNTNQTQSRPMDDLLGFGSPSPQPTQAAPPQTNAMDDLLGFGGPTTTPQPAQPKPSSNNLDFLF